MFDAALLFHRTTDPNYINAPPYGLVTYPLPGSFPIASLPRPIATTLVLSIKLYTEILDTFPGEANKIDVSNLREWDLNRMQHFYAGMFAVIERHGCISPLMRVMGEGTLLVEGLRGKGKGKGLWMDPTARAAFLKEAVERGQECKMEGKKFWLDKKPEIKLYIEEKGYNY